MLTQQAARTQTQARDDLFFAGQLTGVEGYVESAAIGLLAGRFASAALSRRTGSPRGFTDGWTEIPPH